MQRLFGKQKRWLAVWLLWSCAVVSAYAYTSQATYPSAWDTKPTLSRDIDPSYHFRTTSSMAPVVGETSYITTTYTPIGGSRPRKTETSGSWTSPDDEDDPIGVVPGPTPVGEPLAVLLVLALGYVLRKRRILTRVRREGCTPHPRE